MGADFLEKAAPQFEKCWDKGRLDLVTQEGDVRKVLRLLEALDDHDDVQNVWSNFDTPDDVLAAAAAD